MSSPRTGRLIYTICSADGTKVALHVRDDFQDRTKRMWWKRPDGSTGLGGLRTADLPLYKCERLPPDREAPVVVTEGEKAAYSLLTRQMAAVGTVTGAEGCPSPQPLEVLRGRPVVLWPDADDVGRAHMRRVAARLRGVASSVRLVVPPSDAPEGWDAADADEETARRLVAEAVPADTAGSSRGEEEDEEENAADSETGDAVPVWDPFPLETLPPDLARLAAQGARSIGCDPTFIAVAGLVVLASAIGTVACALIKGDWREFAVLWALLVGRSGSARKSPSLELAAAPLQAAESAHFAAWKRAMRDYEVRLQRWQDTPKNKRGERPVAPLRSRAIVEDATLEALAVVLDGSPRGVLLCRDEAAGWLRGFDLYRDRGKGADVPAWLSMYGAKSVTVDRLSRPPIRLEHAFVGVIGTIQPGTVRDCLTPELVEAGLGARILLVYPPERKRGWTDAVIPPGVMAAWRERVGRILLIPRVVDGNGHPLPRALPLDPDARALFAAWVNELGERALAASDAVAAALAKVEGSAARIALVLRLADDPDADAIDGPTMLRALAIARWFAREQERCWSLLGGAEQLDPALDALLEWIGHKDVTVREVTRLGPAAFRKTAKAWSALWALVAAGRGEWDCKGPPGRGATFHRVWCDTSTPAVPAADAEFPASPGEVAGPEVSHVALGEGSIEPPVVTEGPGASDVLRAPPDTGPAPDPTADEPHWEVL